MEAYRDAAVAPLSLSPSTSPGGGTEGGERRGTAGEKQRETSTGITREGRKGENYEGSVSNLVAALLSTRLGRDH
jgi:hypothetical protein